MKTLLLTIILASLTLAGFAQVPESNYQKIRKMNVLADKKRAVLALPHDERVKVWRDHYAYIFLTEELNPGQKEYLTRSLEAFAANELTDALDAEAKDLFDAELGKRVFNPGPYTEIGTFCEAKLNFKPRVPNAAALMFGFTAKKMPGDCICRQTGTNWSCSNSCIPTSCTHTPDGCSIFYMYPCDGYCNLA